MRERLDFSALSKIILDNHREGAGGNREYFENLFSYAFTQTDFIIESPDDSVISKTINGKRALTGNITELYLNTENAIQLKEGVSKVLNNIQDFSYLRQQLEKLVWGDKSISQEQKEKLSKEKSLESFVTECLLFSMNRKFTPKGKNDKKSAIVLSDFLYDYHYPLVNPVFVGREQELIDIHELLKTEDCLFLQGIGGIGKTEFAKQYGKRYADEYENVLYIRYSDSIYQTVCELAFVEDRPNSPEEALFKTHYSFFKSLDENTLVILDNFDNLPEKDDLFNEFLSLSFKLIVTTRNVIEDVTNYQVKDIEAEGKLEELFYIHAPKSKEESDTVKEIIDEVYRHTLTVELAAKTMRATDMLAEELLSALKRERLKLSNPNKVRVTKDEKTRKECLYQHISILFQLQALSKKQCNTLGHLLLIPGAGIESKLFHKWLDTNDFNCVNELIDYGWIQSDRITNYISMHPFIHEVMMSFAPPSFNSCDIFIDNVGEEYIVPVEEELYFRDLLNLRKSILENIVFDDEKLCFKLLSKILSYLSKYCYYETMRETLEIMKREIPMGTDHREERAVYDFYVGNICFSKMNFDKAERHFNSAKNNLTVNEENADFASSLYENLFRLYLFTGKTQEMKEISNKMAELSRQYSNITPIYKDMSVALEDIGSMIGVPEHSNISSLEEILERPKIRQLFEVCDKKGISVEELKLDIDKMIPDEHANDYVKKTIGVVKESMENILPTMNDEIPMLDILKSIIGVTFNSVAEVLNSGNEE